MWQYMIIHIGYFDIVVFTGRTVVYCFIHVNILLVAF